MRKIAFVIPWYGEDISGGAEAELRGLVHHLQNAEVELEVLSTCVKEFRSDGNVNYHEPGLEICAGISVRRFPTRKRDTDAFDRINAKLMAGNKISFDEEKIFMQEMVNSTELYQYIRENKDEYELFVFIPYMFGTTYFGVQECLEKAILMPCLHDEPYAHMKVFKDIFPHIAGMIFLSEPEQALAEHIYGIKGKNFAYLGAGVETNYIGASERFRDKYNIHSQFVLYAGRKDAGKKVDELIDFFCEFKRRNPSDLKLVLIGGGAIEKQSSDILDLGFVSLQDKYDAYAAATVFCNPSAMESFSIVIMESWLARVPVLVNGNCEVTKDFVRKTNGGLYYHSFFEFEGCLNYILNNKTIAMQMGYNGRGFVLQNFSWDVVVEKYQNYFEKIRENIEK